MDKIVTKICFAVLVTGILYAVFAGISFQDEIYTRTDDKEGSIWDDHMEMSQEGDKYYYRTVLPKKNIDEKVIVYNTVHMYLEVRIDNEKVYELKADRGGAVKTTGYYWNIIPLTKEDAGKEIVFQVTPAYSDGKPGGSFYYGTYREVEHKILGERIFRLILAGLIALAGLVMLVYGLLVVRKGEARETIVQFAIFAVMLGIWSICETQILDVFFSGSIAIVFVSHLMLMIMLVPFVLFLRHMYHNGDSRLWSICCYFNCAVIVVRFVLQLMGLYELRETLFLTHISILLFIVIGVGISIHEILVNKITRQIRINSICVLVILASTLLELAIFRFGHKSTPLGSAGFLIYIVVMGVENVRKSRKLMERAKESEIYRKLAFTDELTGLYNRTAFNRDLESRVETDKATSEVKIPPTVIFMFDLNDLKKCNDTYGHDYGDQYIMMAADILQKMFDLDGKCYRIGGDEFCALMPYVSMNEIKEKMLMLERYMKELNRRKFVVTVSMAAGYAVYKEDRDEGLDGTMKRADEMMYEKKQEYKKQRSGT